MYRSICIAVSILFAVFVTAIPADSLSQSLPFLNEETEYLWPTNSSRQLSSTFAETRSAHLHAGLDIRTWGVEGYRVYATRDAVVYRIGMSPFGYGNVIYLKHDDGIYSVYAHLNRFEPKLHAFADSIRFAQNSASINKVVEQYNIRYQQGDVIAYTGSTGVGPPHLHFELRSPDFKPFNPLLTNLRDRVTDTIPPVFRQLGIEYLDPKTLRPERHEIKNATGSGSRYDFGEIVLNGPAGLSVNVHDRANDTPNVYAVHTLTVLQEADTLFHSQADYFPHIFAQHMFLDRSYSILAQTRRGFQRLYRVSANQLPFYHKTVNEGIINFEDGTYQLRIIASDIYGNRAVATVRVRVNGNNENAGRAITHVPVYPNPYPVSNLPFMQWNEYHVDDSIPVLITSTSNRPPYAFQTAPFRVFSGKHVEKTLYPGRNDRISTPDQKVWVTFPEAAIYDTLRLRMNVVEASNEIRINFEPNRLPIQGNAQFTMILPDHMKENKRLALFSVDQFRDRRFFLRSENSNGIIRANLREISNLVVTEDNTPPWVGQPRIDRNLAGNHLVIVPARDMQTGIDYSRSKITVNGEHGLVEYDPEKNWLMFYNPDFRPRQSNRIEITVYDGVGNKTTRSNVINY